MVDTSIHRVVDMKTWTEEIGEGDEAFLVQKFVFTNEDNNDLEVRCFLKRGKKVSLDILTDNV